MDTIPLNNFSIQVNNSWNSGKPLLGYRKYAGLPVTRYQNTADKYQLHTGIPSLKHRKIPLITEPIENDQSDFAKLDSSLASFLIHD